MTWKPCRFTQHPLKNRLLPKKRCVFRIHFWPKSLPPPKKKGYIVFANNLTWRMAPLPNLEVASVCSLAGLYWHTYFLGKVDWSLMYKKSSNQKKKIHQQNWFQSNSPLFPAKLTPPPQKQDFFKLRKHDKYSWSQPHGQRLWDTPVAAERKSPGWALHPAAWSNHLRNPRLNQLSLAVFILPFTRFYTSFRWFPESVNHD